MAPDLGRQHLIPGFYPGLVKMAPENLFNNRQWRPRRPSTQENGDRPGLSAVPPWPPEDSRPSSSPLQTSSRPTGQARSQWGLQQRTSTSGGSALRAPTGMGRDAEPISTCCAGRAVNRQPQWAPPPVSPRSLPPVPPLGSPCGISSEIRSIAGLSRLRYPQQSGNGVDEPQRWRNAPSPVAGRAVLSGYTPPVGGVEMIHSQEMISRVQRLGPFSPLSPFCLCPQHASYLIIQAHLAEIRFVNRPNSPPLSHLK